MAGVLEDIQKQLDQNTAAISKLNDQLKGLEHEGGVSVTRSTNALDTKSNHCNEKPARESGYVNWDESHDTLKNMRWMSCDLFRRRILGIEKNYDSWCWPVNEDSDCETINENTRFPQAQILYVNVCAPKIKYVIQYYRSIFETNAGCDTEITLIAFIDNHLHTRSSFEEKYKLIWVILRNRTPK